MRRATLGRFVQHLRIWAACLAALLYVAPAAAITVTALTYDPDRRSLFSVTNKPAKVIELSLQGDLLRTIDLEGFGDPEAIEYVAPLPMSMSL